MILRKDEIVILYPTGTNSDVYSLIELAGRTCYKSEDKITKDSAADFVRMIIARGHESVLEHVSISVRIITNRGVTHELVRHRIASYSQESTRYCDYRGSLEFIIPTWCEHIEPGEYDVEWEGLYGACDHTSFKGAENIWFWNMAIAERDYKKIRKQGWRPEQARELLPNSLKTEVVTTMNCRQWRHFFNLRRSKAAHPQMKYVANLIFTVFHKRWPVIFS